MCVGGWVYKRVSEHDMSYEIMMNRTPAVGVRNCQVRVAVSRRACFSRPPAPSRALLFSSLSGPVNPWNVCRTGVW